MPPLTTEADWLASESPRDLAAFAHLQVPPARFRWLALKWGLGERRFLNWHDESEFDRFAAWVAGPGPQPAPDRDYAPTYGADPDRSQRLSWAYRCLHAIQSGDFAGAAAFGAEGALADGRDIARAFAAEFRCAAGNPFRPAALDAAWLSPDVLGLARSALDSADFALLPILADALEEAGCDSAELLGHLRGGEPHTRGCWALEWARGAESPPSATARNR